MTRSFRTFGVAIGLVLAVTFSASQTSIARPPITGITSVEVFVTDPAASKDFYEKALRLPASPECPSEIVACLTVNGHQQLRLVKAPSPVPANMIGKTTFATPDVLGMRRYLISKGLTPNPMAGTENQHFSLTDPEGHVLSFTQQAKSSPAEKSPGQLSTHLIHTGFISHDRPAEDHFYKDILGFHLYWQGGMKDQISWVSMQIPDGTDWIEYMLNIAPDASHHTIGVMNHLAFGVVSAQATKEQFLKNGGKITEEPKIGRDGKWQLNLYDPDDTRVEFMEFKPVEKPCCSEFQGRHPDPSEQ